MNTVKAAWLLLTDIATGLVLFAALTAAAVSTHYIANWSRRAGLDEPVATVLKVVEVVLAGADAVCLVSLIGYATVGFIGRLRKGEQS